MWMTLVTLNTPKGWTPVSVAIPEAEGLYRVCWDTGLGGDRRYAAWAASRGDQVAERFADEVESIRRHLERRA